MAMLKCKMCGGDLDLQQGQSVAVCEYCGSRQTVPSLDNEKKLRLFERANQQRAACAFDKAAGIYETIITDFPEEAEAYWGLVLCKYGIEYVDDPTTGEKIPTCHRSSYDSVLDDSDYNHTLENADPISRKVYQQEARAIDEIRKGIIEVSSKEEPYDIFICYKETDSEGERTLDSVIAQDIYNMLTGKGYRVFFSRITLEDKLGVEYEPYIFAALNSAKIMLAVGTDYEYYNAVWVRNEWSRFLKLMAKDPEKKLFPVFKGLDAYDMPKEFQRLQALDYGKLGADQDLLHGIEKVLPKKQPAPAVRKPEPPVERRPEPPVVQPVQQVAMTMAQQEELQKTLKHVHFVGAEKETLITQIHQAGIRSEEIQRGCKLKKPGMALLLSIFLGMLGVDRFYLGQVGFGIAKIFLVSVTNSIFYFIDWFLIKKETRKTNRKKLFEFLRRRDPGRFGNLPKK